MNVSLGFTWNPGGSRTAIRGGYGVFYDWYDANLHDQTIRVNGELQRDLLILDPGYPDPRGGVAAEVLPGGRVQADPNLTLPYVQQASIGVERPIGPFLTLQTSYQRQRGGNQLRSRNINAPDEFGVRPDPSAGTITQIESDGGMASDRLTLNANYRIPQRNIFFNVGYTLADAKNHANNATVLPANSRDPDAEWGPSSQDIRHRVFTIVNYTFPLGIRANITNQYSSAAPFTITTGSDNNRDGVSNDRPSGVGRNTERSDSRFDTSLRVTRIFGFGGPRPVEGGRPEGAGPAGGGPGGDSAGAAAGLAAVALVAARATSGSTWSSTRRPSTCSIARTTAPSAATCARPSSGARRRRRRPGVSKSGCNSASERFEFLGVSAPRWYVEVEPPTTNRRVKPLKEAR